jgi:hypothetical protein
MSQTVTKLAAIDLASLTPHVGLSPEASAATAGSGKVEDALAKLEAGGFLMEATRLMAHALPKREAVWWSCMCSSHTAPPDLPEPDQNCRRAAEEWVRGQNEKLRYAAWDTAQASGYGTPEVYTAIAAFWSGGSMSPEGQPAVPPQPHFTGNAVAGVIALSAVRGDPTKRDARLKRFLESGRNIAAGGPGRLPPETA